MKDIIREIWEIRGMLDEAIARQDKKKYDAAKNRFFDYIDTDEYKKSVAAGTLNISYQSDEDMIQDREQNFNKIILSWKNLLNKFRGEKTSIESFEPTSVLELVWMYRGEFDEALNIPANNIETAVSNLGTLGRIESSMTSLASRYYTHMNDDKTNQERNSLRKIAVEINFEKDMYWCTKINKHEVEEMMKGL